MGIIFSRTAKVACKMTKILWKQSKRPEMPRSRCLPSSPNSRTPKLSSNPLLLCSSNLLPSASPWTYCCYGFQQIEDAWKGHRCHQRRIVFLYVLRKLKNIFSKKKKKKKKKK